MPKPDVSTYPAHFSKYINLVEEDDIITAITNQRKMIERFFNAIPREKYNYKYAEGKWSLKECLQHIIDIERIFSFRALAFAREDIHILPSFNENSYADKSNASQREWNDLVNEFLAVRRSTEYLFNSFSQAQLDAMGKASDYSMSANAMGYTLAGHLTHHINIIKERYLNY